MDYLTWMLIQKNISYANDTILPISYKSMVLISTLMLIRS